MQLNDWLARIVRQNTEATGGAAPETPPADATPPAESGGDGGKNFADRLAGDAPPAEPPKENGAGGDQPANEGGDAERADPFAGYDEETAAWLKKKGFDKHENPGPEIANSLRNLEKLHGAGADRLLVKPDENSPQEVKDRWNEAVGVPKEPGAYEAVEGFQADDPLVQGFQKLAHERGISGEAYKAALEFVRDQGAEVQAAEQNAFNDSLDQLESKAPAQVRQMQEAFAKRGVTTDEVMNAMTGDAKTRADAFYKMMAKMSGGLTERGNPLPDDAGDRTVGVTAEQAQDKIGKLLSDDAFQKRYHSKDRKTRQGAIDEMVRLRELAASGR